MQAHATPAAQKHHQCHQNATPAAQKGRTRHQMPRLAHKVSLHVSKCHACCACHKMRDKVVKELCVEESCVTKLSDCDKAVCDKVLCVK